LLQGFVVIDRNFHSRFGEIDIIAIKDGVMSFFEVKSGQEAHSRITKGKLSKIIKTVDYYLLTKKIDMPYQISAIIIIDDVIDIYENITL
jgi:putative endonuclease